MIWRHCDDLARRILAPLRFGVVDLPLRAQVWATIR
jgi:hypothetical protein